MAKGLKRDNFVYGLFGNEYVSLLEGSKMITVEDATEQIYSSLEELPVEQVTLKNSFNQILGAEVLTDRPIPPFNRVAMDGIAISLSDWNGGQRTFSVKGVQRAGDPQKSLTAKNGCIEVMTGAVLPAGCDAVIPVELLTKNEDGYYINLESIDPWLNIHKMGSDSSEGALALQKGIRLLGPQVAILASLGYSKVPIFKTPVISIFSTGDELVPVEQTPLPHQIRRSNSWGIEASLNICGYPKTSQYHMVDNPKLIMDTLENSLVQSDVTILTGGVSMGQFDHIPQVLTDLGVKKVFHKVTQKPGKPIWFGVTKHNRPVFGLPGNPVSAMVCLHRYVIPALQVLTGQTPEPPKKAKLAKDIIFKKSMTLFAPCKVDDYLDNTLIVSSVSGNGSGDYLSLGYSDGFLELPKDKDAYKAGEYYSWYPWH